MNKSFDVFLFSLWMWVGFEVFADDMIEQYFFIASISGGVGMFVPMVIVAERGDATYALSLFQILVSYNQFCCIILCMLGENDCRYLWVINKIAQNGTKSGH